MFTRYCALLQIYWNNFYNWLQQSCVTKQCRSRWFAWDKANFRTHWVTCLAMRRWLFKMYIKNKSVFYLVAKKRLTLKIHFDSNRGFGFQAHSTNTTAKCFLQRRFNPHVTFSRISLKLIGRRILVNNITFTLKESSSLLLSRFLPILISSVFCLSKLSLIPINWLFFKEVKFDIVEVHRQ